MSAVVTIQGDDLDIRITDFIVDDAIYQPNINRESINLLSELAQTIRIDGRFPNHSIDEGEVQIQNARKIVDWVLTEAKDKKAYCKFRLTVKSAEGLLMQDIIFEKAFVECYEEWHGDNHGDTMFTLTVRENIEHER